jgi:hypothetical protein
MKRPLVGSSTLPRPRAAYLIQHRLVAGVNQF